MNTLEQMILNAQQTDENLIDALGEGYITIQWAKGDPKMVKHTKGIGGVGGWWISKDRVSDNLGKALKGIGWEETEYTTRDGSDIPCYYTPDMVFSWIADRQITEYRVKEGNDSKVVRVSNGNWDDLRKVAVNGYVTTRLQVMVVQKGLEDFEPMVITAAGSVQMGLDHRNTPRSVKPTIMGVYGKAMGKLIGNKKGAPTFMFWVKVGIARDEKGNAIFVERGTGNDKTSMVLPMLYDVPLSADKVTNDLLTAAYVGNETYNKFVELRTNAEEWIKAWENYSEETATDKKQDKKEEVNHEDIPL